MRVVSLELCMYVHAECIDVIAYVLHICAGKCALNVFAIMISVLWYYVFIFDIAKVRLQIYTCSYMYIHVHDAVGVIT